MIQTNRIMAAGLLVLGGAVLALLLVPMRGCGDQYDTLLNRDIVDNNITNSKVDAWGRQIVKSSSNYVTKEELRKSQNQVVAAVREDLVGPIRNLERTTRVIATKIDRLQLGVRDTVIDVNGRATEAKTFTYSSAFMPRLKGVLTVDSVWLDYEIRADYQLEYRWKPSRGMFSAKELEVIVRSNDPSVVINKVQTLSLKNPTPWHKKALPLGVAGFGGGLLVGLIVNR